MRILGEPDGNGGRLRGRSVVRFVSTRGGQISSLDEALLQGIAADGGLFLPQELPQMTADDFAADASLQDTASIFLRPFFADSELAQDLKQIVAETFHFPVPVTSLQDTGLRLDLLQLYHGPTAAFKDIGAAFLAACLTRLQGDAENPLTILVATSGDTGGAVAAAFNDKVGMRVVVLYPDGKVSDRQAHQLTCWGDNVLSLAVDGTFDDCQALVKGALADEKLSARYRFSSANSINIGRLLPQSVYYAHASTQHFHKSGRMPGFIIPTGNLGNGLACVLARDMGLPIGPILLATNENRVIAEFLDSGEWAPRRSIATLASAMDVGNPSNMERLRSLHGEAGDIAQQVRAIPVSDLEIEEQIRLNDSEFGIVTCPHTATATHVWRNLSDQDRSATDWIAVATAHPAKFEQIVEPIIGEAVALPAELERILQQPRRFVRIKPEATALNDALLEKFAT
jgi:threonine synthase